MLSISLRNYGVTLIKIYNFSFSGDAVQNYIHKGTLPENIGFGSLVPNFYPTPGLSSMRPKSSSTLMITTERSRLPDWASLLKTYQISTSQRFALSLNEGYAPQADASDIFRKVLHYKAFHSHKACLTLAPRLRNAQETQM